MTIKTAQEIKELKNSWKSDPIWDIANTEGFEAHREELQDFQNQCESEWKKETEEKEREIDCKAEQLGVKGLYRLLMKHEELLERHSKALDLISEGKSHQAYRVLRGYY